MNQLPPEIKEEYEALLRKLSTLPLRANPQEQLNIHTVWSKLFEKLRYCFSSEGDRSYVMFKIGYIMGRFGEPIGSNLSQDEQKKGEHTC